MPHLTYAEILDRKKIKKLVEFSSHSTIFSNIVNSSNANFFLIIYVDGKQFVKMHIYPIAENAVVKITIEGDGISNDVLIALSNLARRMNVIHTSGFVFVKNHVIFEMYLGKTGAFQKFEEVQREFTQLKTIDRVALEEIDPKHPSTVN
ncbi:MAG: hypothetical protein RBG13Loki_1506 [Promethearchaeota archaeon CR_4]|nr:MAG: hypothetical protein RBG13Loki_1506 [Candidatus Lokiarchaeota archaeon CR_4]